MPLPSNFWQDEYSETLSLLVNLWVEAGWEGARAVMDTMNQAGMPAVDEAVVYASLLDWVGQHAPAQAALIAQTTEEAVEQVLLLWDGEDLEELIFLLTPIFGVDRAETIALNEVILGISIGNLLAWLAYGTITQVVWKTADDERVCPICAPRHDVVVSLSDALFDFYPPAHPRCRCWLEAILVLSRNLELVEALFRGRVELSDLERIAVVQ